MASNAERDFNIVMGLGLATLFAVFWFIGGLFDVR